MECPLLMKNLQLQVVRRVDQMFLQHSHKPTLEIWAFKFHIWQAGTILKITFYHGIY